MDRYQIEVAGQVVLETPDALQAHTIFSIEQVLTPEPVTLFKIEQNCYGEDFQRQLIVQS